MIYGVVLILIAVIVLAVMLPHDITPDDKLPYRTAEDIDNYLKENK